MTTADASVFASATPPLLVSGGGDLAAAVMAALGTVLDPEIDEPITDLGFVAECVVGEDGAVAVELQLPTFFCAPNFTFLMVADAYDAIGATPGVSSVRVVIRDHHASSEINDGVAAAASFEDAFGDETNGDLAEVRRTFLAKAVMAGQDRVARPLVDAGATPSDLVATVLGELADTDDVRRLRRRRAAVGLPCGDDAPLLIHADGSAVTVAQVPLHLRRARLTRIGMETNAHYCQSLLATRYGH